MPKRLESPKKIIKYGRYILKELIENSRLTDMHHFFDAGQAICYYESNDKREIRRKYNIPKEHQIVIKKGVVMKDLPSKSCRQRLMEAQQEVLQAIENEDKTAEIVAIVHQAEQEIGALTQAQKKIPVTESDCLHDQINLIVEKMFAALSEAIEKVVHETYESTYTQSVSVFREILANTQAGPVSESLVPELFDELCPWLEPWIEKEKKQLLKEIAEEFTSQTDPESTEKGFLSVVIIGGIIVSLSVALNGCSDSSKKVTKDAAEETAHIAAMEALRRSFVEKGVEEYRIVGDSDEKTCSTCAEMAGKVFAMDDFRRESTAPPFHPNCRCSIEVYVPEVVEEEIVDGTSPTAVSEELISFLKDYEGYHAMPYRGVDDQNRTVGYGHVIVDDDGTMYDNGVTQEEAEELLQKDLKEEVYQYLNTWISEESIVLTQQQYDALVSFTFNVGQIWIIEYNDLRNILRSDNITYEAMYDEFIQWADVNDVIVLGLYRRRMDELNIFFNGDYTRTYPDLPIGG